MIQLPMAYWVETRLTTTGKQIQYLLVVLGPQIFWLVWAAGLTGAVPVFLALFVAMICVYEFGYFLNDHWARKREIAAGLAVRKGPPPEFATGLWVAAIAGRIITIAVALFLSFNLGAGIGVPLAWLVVLFAIFQAHNFVLGRSRSVTFCLLYFVRMQLPLIVAVALQADVRLAALSAWIMFSAVNSVCFTVSYSMKKSYLPAPFWLVRMGGVELPLLVLVCVTYILALIGIVLELFGIDGTAAFSVILAELSTFLLSYFLIWSTLRFAVQVYRGRHRARTVLSHCHTYFSHDSTITKIDYTKWLAVDANRTVFLTDHAEDFDTQIYEDLKEEFRDLGPRVIPGLEYPICNQHILAHDLGSYADLSGLSPQHALATLKDHSQRLIWAHPRVSLRKLRHPSYWAGLLTLSAGVDGVEFYNRKNVFRVRYVLMMLAIAWISCALYGSRELFLGVDAHKPIDLAW